MKDYKKASFKMEDIPDWEEVKEFWDDLVGANFLGKVSDRDFMIATLFVWYGRRISEIAELTIDDIDFSKGNRGVINFLQKKTRTGKKERVALPVLPPIEKFLKAYINKHITPFQHKRLFNIKRRQITNVLHVLTEEYMGAKLRPHAFRHAIGDYLVRRKGLKYAQYWLGHSSISTTDIYTHMNIKKITEDLPEEFK